MQAGWGFCVSFGVLITFSFSQGDKIIEKSNSKVIIIVIIDIKTGWSVKTLSQQTICWSGIFISSSQNFTWVDFKIQTFGKKKVFGGLGGRSCWNSVLQAGKIIAEKQNSTQNIAWANHSQARSDNLS